MARTTVTTDEKVYVDQIPAKLNIGVPQEDVYDFGDESDFADTRMEERSTSFLRMLQGQSPQLRRDDAKYIPGAQQGQIFDTAAEEVFDAVDLIVCGKDYHFGRWVPRVQGQVGFRGTLPPEHPLVLDTLERMDSKYGPGRGRFHMPRYDDKMRKWSDEPPLDPETNEEIQLVETGQLFVKYAPIGELMAGTGQRAIVAFTASSLKSYQSYNDRHMRWLWPTRQGMREARIWAYRWRLVTKLVSFSQGDTYVWRLGLTDPAKTYKEAFYRGADPELYAEGQEFAELIRGGGAKLKKEDYEAGMRTAGSTIDAEDVPF